MPRSKYWGLLELRLCCWVCTIPPTPISSASPALPPSLVLRLLIPRRAEAAVFCLLLLSDVDTVTTLEEVEVAEVAEKRCLL